jgi:DNA-binding CsgD family transcriptional regulator
MGSSEENKRHHSILDDLVALWPGVRYLALGLWLSWAYLAYSGSFWLSDVEVNGAPLSNMYLVSTACCALVLLVAPFLSRQFERILASNVWILGAGVLTMLGSFAIILSGPHFLFLSSLFWLGSAVTGLGTGILALKCGQFYGELKPWRALIYTLISQMIIVVIYFFVLGNESYYPIPGGPSLAGIIGMMLLPLLAAVLLTIKPSTALSVDGTQEYDPHLRIGSLSPVFWKFLLAVLVFTLATSVVRGLFTNLQPPDVIVAKSSTVMMLTFIFVIAFLLVTVRYLKHINFGKLYLFFMVVIAISIAVIPLLKIDNAILTSAITFSSSVFDFLVWCLLAFIVFEKRISSNIVFGFGRGIFMAGSALGWLLGVYAMPRLSGTSGEAAVYIVLAFLVLICTTLVFSEKDFDSLFSPFSEYEHNLRDLLPQTIAGDQFSQSHADRVRPYIAACKRTGEKAKLSSREQEILELLAMGRGNENMARKLSVSLNTVRTHTHNIYSKLDVHSREELIELIENERDGVEKA